MRETPDIHIDHPQPGATVVVMRGDHDVANAGQLGQLLGALLGEHGLVVVDVTGAEFVDSSIVSVLVQAKKEAEAADATLRLQMGTQDIVRRAFELAGVVDYLETAATREEVLREASAASVP